jgi:hypothetical protein
MTSVRGSGARDVMLGLAKTCAKQVFDYIGDRLSIPGAKIRPLATLVNPAPSWNTPAREFAPVTHFGTKRVHKRDIAPSTSIPWIRPMDGIPKG